MADHKLEDIVHEKERVGKLSQIRELVFGAQDGLLVPLGVISSVAGAFGNNHIVIIAGISEALAGAFSMATGAYLSSQAEKQVHEAEIAAEKAEIVSNPDREKDEMAYLFQSEGVEAEDSKKLVEILAKYGDSFANTMLQKELGLEPQPVGTPRWDAVVVGVSYIVSAMVPLSPYFFISGLPAIGWSISLTFLALFVIGLAKGRVASLPLVRSGIQVMIVGAGAGFGGYILGTVLPKLLFGI